MYWKPFTYLSPAGARSEALASAQLELHGLQDMLDDLLGWIAAADSRMSATEATPIGTDIETVERQLAEHEVRGLASRIASK